MDTKNWFLPSNIPEHQKKAIIRILSATLSAVDPERAVKRCLIIENNFIRVKSKRIPICSNTRIFVIAIGKAAVAMAQGADRVLGEQYLNGIIVPKHFPETQILPEKYLIQPGSHPEPDEKSQQAAIAVLSLLEQTNADDVVIFLISGGGSALLSFPVNPLTINDLKDVTHHLLASGANIQEMNVVRKKLDQVKGGKLALAAFPSQNCQSCHFRCG